MMKIITIAGLVCLISACSSNGMSESQSGLYSAHKSDLLKQEKENPLSFLKVYASDKKNMWGGTVVKGVISNTATVCSYNNIRVKLLSYNKEGKMLEEHEDVITGPIKPNASKDFKIRYHLPRTADSVAVSIINTSVTE